MCDGRAIYAGYFPALRTIHVVVVNPFQNRDLTPSFLEKQFRDACQALDIDSPLLQEGAKFKVDYPIFKKNLGSLCADASTIDLAVSFHTGGLCRTCQGC